MSKTLTAQHPVADVTLTYSPATYTYLDDLGQKYTFATRIAKQYFPEFDAAAAAASKSAKTGRLAEEFLAEWKAKGRESSHFGDQVHDYARAVAVGGARPVSENKQQEIAFRVVDDSISMLADSYEIMGAEILVFDPVYLIAGYIDIGAINRATGALAIIDWKTCEDISADAWGRTMLPPFTRLPDSKLMHYTFDQSIYGFIVESSGYAQPGQPIELALVHIPPFSTSPRWIPLEYLRDEATICAEAHARKQGVTIPDADVGLSHVPVVGCPF